MIAIVHWNIHEIRTDIEKRNVWSYTGHRQGPRSNGTLAAAAFGAYLASFGIKNAKTVYNATHGATPTVSARLGANYSKSGHKRAKGRSNGDQNS